MLTIDATDLPRFMQCNGSRLMSAAPVMGAADTTVRDEGNAAHYHAVETFYNRTPSAQAPNGIFITPEMADHMADYVELLRNCVQDDSDYSEMEVDTSFGTDSFRINARADHVYYSKITGTLHIPDLKYGYRLVEPEMNWTLIAHAIGFCQSRHVEPSRIFLTIHQPRPHHPDGKTRSWQMNWLQLVAARMQISAALANPSDTLQTGPHCYGCRAWTNCPARNASEMNAIDVSTARFDDAVDNERLAQELDLLKLAQATIDAGIAAREELAQYRVKAGQIVPNYFLERQLTNSQWKKFVTPEMLSLLSGKPYTVEKLMTPTQAKKAGLPADTVAAFSERIETGFKLVRIDADKKAKRMLKNG